jgi:hypothetical protein
MGRMIYPASIWLEAGVRRTPARHLGPVRPTVACLTGALSQTGGAEVSETGLQSARLLGATGTPPRRSPARCQATIASLLNRVCW